MKIEEIKVRLQEQVRIYKDSPAVTVTYVDLARLIEDILEIMECKKVNGFSKEEA